jgi:glutamate synthase (NADPH/NADH) large chain
MTGGVAVILGSIGANFGAGMTGGMAYLYDPEGLAAELINMETVVTCPVTVDHWEEQLRGLVEAHVAETGSVKAGQILQEWEVEKLNFLQVCPIEMLSRIPAPLSLEDEAIPAE